MGGIVVGGLFHAFLGLFIGKIRFAFRRWSPGWSSR
jgi:hypothetical protein